MDNKQSIWDLAAEAAKEVATWPLWKVRAADQALVSRPERDKRVAHDHMDDWA